MASGTRDVVADLQKLSISGETQKHEEGAVPVNAAATAARAAFAKDAIRHDEDGWQNSSNDTASKPKHTGSDTSKHQEGKRQTDISSARSSISDPALAYDTHDTTVTTTKAPAVTHETVKVMNHEILHPVVHQDIHEHHEVTHILPIKETVVKPARHFIETEDGQKVEIAPPTADHARSSSVDLQPNSDLKTTSSANVIPKTEQSAERPTVI